MRDEMTKKDFPTASANHLSQKSDHAAIPSCTLVHNPTTFVKSAHNASTVVAVVAMVMFPPCCLPQYRLTVHCVHCGVFHRPPRRRRLPPSLYPEVKYKHKHKHKHKLKGPFIPLS
jgi:hypothetical protein